MMLQTQKQEVSQLAALAAEQSAAARQRRAAYKCWKQRAIGSPKMLAAIFAAGAIWAAARTGNKDKDEDEDGNEGRSERNDHFSSKRLVVGAANLMLIGWRFLAHRKIVQKEEAAAERLQAANDDQGHEFAR
jgi:hypothetical protein